MSILLGMVEVDLCTCLGSSFFFKVASIANIEEFVLAVFFHD